MRGQTTAHTAVALLGALLLYGCASSSRSSLPSPPQLPSPSPPSAGKPESAPPTASPQTPSPTSPQGQGEGKAGQQGQAGGGPGSKGETGAGSSSGSPASGGGPAAGTSSGAGTAASGAGATGATGGTSGAGGGEGMARTPGEQSDALDRQLQAGLAEFDSLLLREQKALEEKRRNQPLPPRGAEEGAGSGTAGGQGPGGEGAAEKPSAAERQADAEAAGAEGSPKEGAPGTSAGGAPDTGTGGSPDAGRHEGGTPVTAPVEGGAAGGGADRSVVPPDVGDGRDDDVVARQLREAAMKEKDPVLREKLWQEYREYKKSVGK